MEGKFWLRPVSLATNYGFTNSELSRIRPVVDEHCEKLRDAYIRYHGSGKTERNGRVARLG
ncbi:MAG TPA: hypothetical protein VGR78_13895 [Verrucomicrobiae bacterium]|nr:hypothetical protein [Verrucomicrobiae bacterium]